GVCVVAVGLAAPLVRRNPHGGGRCEVALDSRFGLYGGRMGGPDQFIKDLFRDETASATGDRVLFEVPPEVPTRQLTPDGRFTCAVALVEIASLPAPLCHLRGEALVDVKMPGDHTDRPALARAVFRRWARWVSVLEEAKADATALLNPRDFCTWVVAPHVPGW